LATFRADGTAWKVCWEIPAKRRGENVNLYSPTTHLIC